MSDPLIGKQLGDYVIQSLLGRGGMARVYKGYDERLQRYAAVKVINSDFSAADQAEYTERFRREARAIARLQHPNIVGVYQFGEFEGNYYMAMVFLDGKDLRQILKEFAEKRQLMPLNEVLNIIRGIGSALDYAHSRGVIHRDIKPSNIVIDTDDRAILTDFGLALSTAEGTLGDTFGSAHYIAPEQAVSSAKAVAQSDLYSLGVCLYEMLAGKVPFDDPSAMSVALKHLNEAPPPPRQYNPDVSPAVEQVVFKILDKDPLQRYASGAAFAQALEEAIHAGIKITRPAPAVNVEPSTAIVDTRELVARADPKHLQAITGENQAVKRDKAAEPKRSRQPKPKTIQPAPPEAAPFQDEPPIQPAPELAPVQDKLPIQTRPLEPAAVQDEPPIQPAPSEPAPVQDKPPIQTRPLEPTPVQDEIPTAVFDAEFVKASLQPPLETPPDPDGVASIVAEASLAGLSQALTDDRPTPIRPPVSDEGGTVATFGGGNVVWDASDASRPVPPPGPSGSGVGLAAGRGDTPSARPRHRARWFVLLTAVVLLVALGIAYFNGALQGIVGGSGTPTGPAILASGTTSASAQTATAPTAASVTAGPSASGTRARTPTATSSPTRTRTATATATLTATSTATATVLLATASSTPSSTPVFTGGSLDAVLIYDESQVVLINTRNYTINVSKLAFVQRGKTELRLQIANFWYTDTPFSSTALPPQFCFQAFRVDRVQPVTLNNCRIAAWARVADIRWFWIAQDSSVSSFDVLSGDRVLTTCSISAGRCEISLS